MSDHTYFEVQSNNSFFGEGCFSFSAIHGAGLAQFASRLDQGIDSMAGHFAAAARSVDNLTAALSATSKSAMATASMPV